MKDLLNGMVSYSTPFIILAPSQMNKIIDPSKTTRAAAIFHSPVSALSAGERATSAITFASCAVYFLESLGFTDCLERSGSIL